MKLLELFAGIGGVSQGWYSALSRETIAESSLTSVEYHAKNLKASQYWGRISKSTQPDWGHHQYLVMPVEEFIPQGCYDWVHASPPCNTASVVNKEKEGENDIALAHAIIRSFIRARPRIFTLENVTGYRSYLSYSLILGILRTEGYHIQELTIDASQWGVPQKRKRLVLVATKEKRATIVVPNLTVRWEEVLDGVEEGDYLVGRAARSGKIIRAQGEPLWTLICYQFHDHKYAARRKAVALVGADGGVKRYLSIAEIGRLGGLAVPNDPKRWAFLGRAIGQSVPPPVISGLAKQLL